MTGNTVHFLTSSQLKNRLSYREQRLNYNEVANKVSRERMKTTKLLTSKDKM